MNNKKLIRRDNVAGKFTTVHHSILNDTRLSSTDFRILVSILSDADHFNLTRELIINRFGFDKKTVQQSFKNFEECGYMKRTELKRGYFYTISEYGNLNSKDEQDGSDDDSTVATSIEIKQKIKEVEPKLSAQANTQFDLAEHIELLDELLPKNLSNDTLTKGFGLINDEIEKGFLTDSTQLTKGYVQAIFDNFQPSQSEIKKRILELCDENAGGHKVTIDAKKQITAKTVKFFEKYDGEITDRLIKSRILSIKSPYVSTGHLDQRYQN